MSQFLFRQYDITIRRTANNSKNNNGNNRKVAFKQTAEKEQTSKSTAQEKSIEL